MQGLLIIALGSLLARTAIAWDPDLFGDTLESDGVNGCTGKLVVTPPFKKGDIE